MTFFFVFWGRNIFLVKPNKWDEVHFEFKRVIQQKLHLALHIFNPQMATQWVSNQFPEILQSCIFGWQDGDRLLITCNLQLRKWSQLLCHKLPLAEGAELCVERRACLLCQLKQASLLLLLAVCSKPLHNFVAEKLARNAKGEEGVCQRRATVLWSLGLRRERFSLLGADGWGHQTEQNPIKDWKKELLENVSGEKGQIKTVMWSAATLHTTDSESSSWGWLG